MAHIIKKGPIKVPTQPKDFDLQATGLVFKSYDNQIALEFNVAQQDGTPADLLGANLRLLMFIYDEVDGTIKKEPIPFITKNLITESFLNGHVVYILPEAMKAYNGMVEAYVYIEYPDGSTSDNLGFTFRMKRSAIDGLAQDKADYFIEDFKQLLAAASLEANKVIEGLDTEIKNLQQATKDANAAVDGAMDRIDGLEAEIGQLERLREMYIDTLDFGDYDYSGNPNLMANINADSFSQGTGALSVVDDGDEVVVTLDPNHKLELFKAKSQPNLLTDKTYTVSVEIMLEGDFTGDPSKIGLRYIKMPNWVSELYTRNTLTATKGVWQKLTGTVKITAASDNAESWLIMLQNKDANNSLSGKLRLRHAKLEEGSTATPFQPNLLAEPYNMCREYPNENIADPTVEFPIESGDHQIYQGYTEEELMIGQTYTITLKGTKPASQTFVAYNHWTARLGELKPVDGLTDVWSLTFTPTNVVAMPKLFRVYQYPQSTVGACRIDWIKIEKSKTRTPINVPTYKGLGILDSNDPTKYVWNYTELVDVDGIQDALENVEQRTATLEGKANTIDGRLNNVSTALNTVQSTADQILAEVTAADAMKETDLPSYLANKPIVAGGMADFAGKVTKKVHPNPHKCAIYASTYDGPSTMPNFAYEVNQKVYEKLAKNDGALQSASTNEAGKIGVFAFKFDLISQIAKDYPSFFDDCPTQETKVTKIRNYIESAVLTIHSKNTNGECYISSAVGNTWLAEVKIGSYNESAVTEKVYDQLKQNLFTRAHVQDDGSIIFRSRTRTADTTGGVQIQTDYVRFDYTLDLSSDDFITPIERDVTKDNLTQILSDDSATIKGAMDFKFKDRGNNTNCPHTAYEANNKPQVVNMSQLDCEAEANVYNQIQNKADGLTRLLTTNGEVSNVPQAKYKFDLVTAIEKEHPHLFKGLTTTKQKVDVLKAKMQELKFNVWARGEGTNGNIQIGSSLSNVDAIDTPQLKDIGETAEFARVEFYSSNNDACARRINDDGTVLYWLCGSAVSDSLPQPKVIIDYVNLEYTLSDKISEHVVKQNDEKYLDTVSKTTTATSDIAKIKTLIASMLQTETIKLDQSNTDFIRAGMIVMQRTMNTVTVYACFQTAKELTNGTIVYTPPVNFKPINSMGLVDGSYSGGADAQMYFNYENGGALKLNTTIPNEKWFTGGGTYTVDVVKLPQGF